MSKEIERQFVTEREPNLGDLCDALDARGDKGYMLYTEDQFTAYLYTEPAQVRIRKADGLDTTKCYLTVKGTYMNLTTRTEVEMEITEEQYEEILALIGKNPVHKKCVVMEIGDRKFNFSTVDPGMDTSFTFAEVEFPSEEAAAAFTWPFPNLKYTEVTGGMNTDTPVWKSMSMPLYWATTRLNK
ncbi:MAG: hypothetical protein NC311_06545 [Muribaculaceae bacterium]|nr:hypothetical protein [Muribaculaceae bacterium]